MYLDKIYVLQTGVSLKISTSALQELIANAIGKQKIPELESLHSLSDLCAYLSVVVSEGAEDLINRRQRWIDQKNKSRLNRRAAGSIQQLLQSFLAQSR